MWHFERASFLPRIELPLFALTWIGALNFLSKFKKNFKFLKIHTFFRLLVYFWKLKL